MILFSICFSLVLGVLFIFIYSIQSFRSSRAPWKLKCRWMLRDWSYRIQKIVWRIWNANIKRRWYKLFPAKNEFHSSYDLDLRVLLTMDDDAVEVYREEQFRRRLKAHAKEPF